MKVQEALLLDQFLPRYDFNEVHAIAIEAPPHKVFAAIKTLTPSELSPLVHLLLTIRALPAKLLGRDERQLNDEKPFLEQLYAKDFIPLAEAPDREVVFGLIGQFWRLIPGKAPDIASAEAFLSFDDPDYAKVTANLAVLPGDTPGNTRCVTETRIYVPDPKTRRKFATYWRIISMGSALIRLMWLRAIKRRAEVT